MPYIPGCVYDRPPPLVLVGSVPPGPVSVDSTNATAFALGAEAEVLEVQQRGDGERVVAHQQVDVARLDAGLARRRPVRTTAPAVVARSGIWLIIEWSWHVAAPSTYTGGLAQRRGPLGARHHERAGAVGDEAAVEQVQRRRHHLRAEHVVDRDRVLEARLRVQSPPTARVLTAICASCSDVVPYIAMCRLAARA